MGIRLYPKICIRSRFTMSMPYTKKCAQIFGIPRQALENLFEIFSAAPSGGFFYRKIRVYKALVFILVLALHSSFLFADADTVLLKNGRKISGRLRAVTEEEVVLEIRMASAQGTTKYRVKREDVDNINNLTIEEAQARLAAEEAFLLQDKNNLGEISELADAEQLNIRGSQYFSAGQFDKAIETHEKALTKATDTELRAKILTMLSSSYLEKGITSYLKDKNSLDYKKAIDYAEQSLKIKPNYWAALGNIAVVYMNMDNLEKADFYYTEAEKYAAPNSPERQQLMLNHALIKKTLDARKSKMDNENK